MISDIQSFFLDPSGFGPRILETAVILIILLFIHRLIMRFVIRSIDDQDQIYTWRKTSEYIMLFLGLIMIAGLWFGRLENASTYLGLLSAGIAISLQGPLANLFAWIYIISRSPFETGDRIEINGIAGDVIDIHLFKFSMLEVGNWVNAEQSTGRVLHVPNRLVFEHAVANYSQGINYIWNEIEVPLTFESDWEIAQKLLEEIAVRYSLKPTVEEIDRIKQASKRSNVRIPNLKSKVYTTVTSSGVVLTLRYLCKPRRRRNSEHEIWQEILSRFAEESDVDFAYPTQRVFYHPIEGKTLLTDHSEVAHPRNHLVPPNQ